MRIRHEVFIHADEETRLNLSFIRRGVSRILDLLEGSDAESIAEIRGKFKAQRERLAAELDKGETASAESPAGESKT